MTERPVSVRTQAERWGAEAKRLADAGRDVAAFDLYRKAADALPGAPWLQHRTAELAHKLKRDDLSLEYFRRSATGFIKAGFDRRAVAPLRMAWAVARDHLPSMNVAFSDIAHDLSDLLARLALTADAEIVREQTDDALRNARLRSAMPASERTQKRDSWRPTLTPRPASL
ncbi:MAG TPA: hypothetical protein VG937_00805 [Polyangiaceae bacterium]|nr:hypothetical protein [Polyangiaceae bacterium]